jgi:hypothetical protein
MVVEELRRAAEAAPLARLCEVTAALWKAFSAGGVTEAEAEALSVLIDARRAAAGSRRAGQISNPIGTHAGEGTDEPRELVQAARRAVGSRPRTDASMERRRRLAASGPMPPALAARFTTAELAALKIISDDVRKSGVCVLPIDAIAARAGISRTSAQNAIRQACRLGMLERQERRRAYDRSLPSILRVVDREWSAWLRYGPKGGGLKSSSTTDNGNLQGGFEGAETSKSCRGAEIDLRRSGQSRIRARGGAG